MSDSALLPGACSVTEDSERGTYFYVDETAVSSRDETCDSELEAGDFDDSGRRKRYTKKRTNWETVVPRRVAQISQESVAYHHADTDGYESESTPKGSFVQHKQDRRRIVAISALAARYLRSQGRDLYYMPGGMSSTKSMTSSGDVRVNVAGGGVVTTPPIGGGLPGFDDGTGKSTLQRKMSLNPRLSGPPGLEILDRKGMVAIRQQMDVDLLGGCGGPNTYKIWDINDDQLFFATEASGCLCRWTCGPNRRFNMDVFSTSEDLVLNFHRSCCRCDCCCCLDCFMCLQKLYVVDALGRTLGSIRQRFSLFNAKYDILDHDDNVLFKVEGPCCPCRCYTEISFKIFNKTGERQIGRIQKKWGGDRTDEVNVDHELFEVTFPATMDTVDKALIIGAAFLVNFMYYEMS